MVAKTMLRIGTRSDGKTSQGSSTATAPKTAVVAYSPGDRLQQQILQAIASTSNQRQLAASLGKATTPAQVIQAALTRQSTVAIVAQGRVSKNFDAEGPAIGAIEVAEAAEAAVTTTTGRKKPHAMVVATKKALRGLMTSSRKRLVKSRQKSVQDKEKVKDKLAVMLKTAEDLTDKLRNAKRVQVQRVQAAARLGVPPDIDAVPQRCRRQ